MHLPAPILAFEDVAIESNPQYESAIWNISFALGPGELLLVLLDREHRLLPLADAAAGLERPLEGRVRFGGRDWQTLSADDAAAERGRIGRTFAEGGWVSNLDVEENIILAQRHHTQRSETELLDEAATLARQFGLPGLPVGNPSAYRRQDLQKAGCVRACLGEPVLLIVERPTEDVYADLIAPLVNVLLAARRRGTAVLWTTTDLSVWDDPGLRPTARCRMFGSRLHMVPN